MRALDLIIVGGGLRGSLLAIALAERRPDLTFALMEEGNCFGGGPIDPFFLEHLSISGRSLIADAIVAEWTSCLIAFEQEVERQAWAGATVTPAQLHAEVLQRVPDRHLLRQCQSRFVVGRSVIASRGTYEASHVIDLTTRAAPVGLRLWCVAANFQLPENQHFPAPILADVASPDQRWLTQYIPSAPLNVTVRTLSVADSSIERGVLAADGPAVPISISSYPLSIPESAIPELPANPLLPSTMYEAVELAEIVANWDFGGGDCLIEMWANLRSTWRRRYIDRIADLQSLADAQCPEPWRCAVSLMRTRPPTTGLGLWKRTFVSSSSVEP